MVNQIALSSEESFQTLISYLFDAAWNPAEWPLFLESLGKLVGSVCTTLYYENFRSQKGTISVSLDLNSADARFHKSFSHKKAHKQNVFSEDARLSAYVVKPGQQIVCTDFHDDWLLAALILREEFIKANLVCLRPSKAGPFLETERTICQKLIPYLKQALLLHFRLRGMMVMHDAVSQLLNHLTMGVLLVNCNGHILSINRHAAAILNQKDGIWLTDGKLHVWRQEEFKQLLNHILGIAPCQTGGDVPSVRAMQISRNSGRRPISILASPLTTDLQLTQNECIIALFVHDPDEEMSAPDQALRQLYGLTAAEVRLVTFLLKGKTLEEIAETLHVSMSTIRTQIRSVFAKTNTNRQAELIRLLLRNPVMHNPE